MKQRFQHNLNWQHLSAGKKLAAAVIAISTFILLPILILILAILAIPFALFARSRFQHLLAKAKTVNMARQQHSQQHSQQSNGQQNTPYQGRTFEHDPSEH